MAISNIVVYGFGSFGGGVAKLPTHGFGISTFVQEPAKTTRSVTLNVGEDPSITIAVPQDPGITLRVPQDPGVGIGV